MKPEIVLVLGYPASGKTSICKEFPKHERLNRDEQGKSLNDLLPALERAIKAGKKQFVLDNTYVTRVSRTPVLELARRYKIPARCVWLQTSIEDAQYNAVKRIIERHGRLLGPDELKAASRTDPNMFPPAVLFHYRRAFEAPELKEGFADIDEREFVRRFDAGYKGKAIILDYDGTLRRTKSGGHFPRDPGDIEILPQRAKILRRYLKRGYRLLGASNQSDIAKGGLSLEMAEACFARTNKLLRLNIEVAFCPHNPTPINCYCRKPMPGMGVAYIERYKLDPRQTIMVGDMTSDRTFAARCGLQYVDQAEFFAN